ncbi:HlyD family efflux transporter periplasmic adaptor subunit [Falsigemmobacter intermedius]|uniref:HlyD family efflux transporter periplasmic adaptor subunit n=1 Tax=Falsigemmobacter intermedius TaxID=1553448 RepID=A0A3S3U0P9_9RHOB|nr:HlyD family efflux transporter periplasmic adaptor subunit [Falsigemmobacter intermedius]RWY37417.1 HlyD family efflux transporter periplasmic adaptor subunit [Falsigemmobacter intermedius]
MSDSVSSSHIDGSYRRAAVRRAKWTIRLVFLSVVIAIVWAALAQINQITRGDGRVVPMRRMQTIQSLEGGILREIHVREGDIVREGQTIATLDPTRSRAAFLAARSEIDSLEAEITRLEAEVMEVETLDFGPEPTLAQQTELRLFAARRTRLLASLASLEDERRALQEQFDITSPLAERGAVSKMEMLQLRQKLAEIDGRINEARNGYVQDSYRDLAARRARLATLQEEVVRKEDELSRTVVKSPVEGRINNIQITTIGGVIQPGEAFMEITPLDDQLLIETKVLPRDVAFIAPEMPASVKITAYDFAVYGDLRGIVTQISEDTVEEDTPSGKQNFYRVMVQTERSYLERFGEQFPIRPGMVAQVDIESGTQSILSYLTRPLLRARLR